MTQFGTDDNPLIRKQRQKSWVNSLHKRPALAILIINTQIGLAGSVEPLQFSPAKPVAYEGSYFFQEELICISSG